MWILFPMTERISAQTHSPISKLRTITDVMWWGTKNGSAGTYLAVGYAAFIVCYHFYRCYFLLKTNVNFRGRMYLNGMEILNRGGGSWMRYESNYRQTHWSRWRSFRRWKARYFRVYVFHVKPENIMRYFNITFMWEKKIGLVRFFILTYFFFHSQYCVLTSLVTSLMLMLILIFF